MEQARRLVHQLSSSEEKIALFRSLFRGREDVYPRRFESRKTGKSGYAPACANEWVRGICENRASSAPSVRIVAFSRLLRVAAFQNPEFYKTQDPLWKRDYAASVRRLVRDGVDTPLGILFVTAARPIPPEAEGAKRARSASEAFLYRWLETLQETRGRFQMNADLPIAFDGWGRMEIDLLCADLRLVVEVDGAQHLADPVAYRCDRRKAQLLQENGYLVLRYLAEDLAKELDSVLDGILRSLSARRKPGSMAIPITVVRGSRV